MWFDLSNGWCYPAFENWAWLFKLKQMRFVQLWVISSIYLLIIRQDHVAFIILANSPNKPLPPWQPVGFNGQVTDARVNKSFFLYTLFFLI